MGGGWWVRPGWGGIIHAFCCKVGPVQERNARVGMTGRCQGNVLMPWLRGLDGACRDPVVHGTRRLFFQVGAGMGHVRLVDPLGSDC